MYNAVFVVKQPCWYAPSRLLAEEEEGYLIRSYGDMPVHWLWRCSILEGNEKAASNCYSSITNCIAKQSDSYLRAPNHCYPELVHPCFRRLLKVRLYCNWWRTLSFHFPQSKSQRVFFQDFILLIHSPSQERFLWVTTSLKAQSWEGQS